MAIGGSDLQGFPVPKVSLEKQKKIKDILRTVDAAIEKTEALIEKYTRIKDGMMQDLFTRGLTEDGKLRPSRADAPELYQETPIGWIPKDWEVQVVADLALPQKGSTVIGPFGSDLVVSDYRSEGVPIIFVRDVKENYFNWVSDVFLSQAKAFKLYAHRVTSGDLLVTKMGVPPGITCVYPEDQPLAIVTADMIRMSPDKGKVDPEWLGLAVNQDRSKRQVAMITAGVTRPKITLADFRGLKIAVPPLREQQDTASRIKHLQKMLEQERAKLDKLKLQKTGLMHDLLTGKVPININVPELENV